MLIDHIEIATSGRLCRIARLRHEWCEFVDDPRAMVRKLQAQKIPADIFTFVNDVYDPPGPAEYYREISGASVLTISSYKEWWEALNFKVRNKVRKAEKSGVTVRAVELDDEFAKGIERIYAESPVRQGRKFVHYGKKAAAIKEEISSFLKDSCFIGAYYQGELIGFAKLFTRGDVVRTVHIIAKLSERDKPVMDLLIAKSVEICEQKKITHLQYGSWATGGLGAFRAKHGFQRVDVPRYFVPLNSKGALALKMKLHRPLREKLPEAWVDRILAWRRDWYAWKYERSAKAAKPDAGSA